MEKRKNFKVNYSSKFMKNYNLTCCTISEYEKFQKYTDRRFCEIFGIAKITFRREVNIENDLYFQGTDF